MRRPVAVALASSALLLLCAAPLLRHDPDRAQRPGGAAGQARLRGQQLRRRPLPARRSPRRSRSVVDGRASSARLAAFAAPRSAASTESSAVTPFTRASGDLAYANFALAGPALAGDSQAAVRTIRDLPPPAASAVLVSGNTAGFIDQKQSLIDHAAAGWSAIIAADDADPALPAHRLGAAAAEDAADEHDDPGGDARHPGPRLPGRLARRPSSPTPARTRSRSPAWSSSSP